MSGLKLPVVTLIVATLLLIIPNCCSGTTLQAAAEVEPDSNFVGRRINENNSNSSSTTSQQQEEISWCYSSIPALLEVMRQDIADYTSRTVFKLCPNTEYNLDPEANNGDEMVFLTAKSYTTIQCGELGDVSDNCIIQGGSRGFIMGPLAGPGFFFWLMSGVKVKGLIFQQQTDHAIMTINKGDVTFSDCIFRDMAPAGTVVARFDPQHGTTPGPDLMTMTFERCTFESIQQHTAGHIRAFEGIIKAESMYHSIVLNQCIFRHNFFPGTFSVPRGWAIKMVGGSLQVRNTCFYNNSFIGWGFIEAFGNTEVIMDNIDIQSNFAEAPMNVLTSDDARWVGRDEKFGVAANNETSSKTSMMAATQPNKEDSSSTNPNLVTCGFIAQSVEREPQTMEDITCYPANATMCASTGYRTPVVADNTPSSSAGSLVGWSQRKVSSSFWAVVGAGMWFAVQLFLFQ